MILELLIPILIGTYGDNSYKADFDPKTRTITNLVAFPAKDASFIIEDDDYFYAVSENDTPGAYIFDKDLQELSYAGGVGESPCNILKIEDAPYLLTSDYGSGTISVLKIEDGNLSLDRKIQFEGSGPVASQQEHSRIHQVRSIGRGWYLAADLGADTIHILKAGEDGVPVLHSDLKLPAGSGPRHMAIGRNGKWVYCVSEISKEVFSIRLRWKKSVPSLTLRGAEKADISTVSGGADIHIEGRWLYASMRNDHDGIARFRIRRNGLVRLKDYTRTFDHPRNFAITPDGKSMIVACMNSKCVQVFKIGRNGKLVDMDNPVRFDGERPVCVHIMD